MLIVHSNKVEDVRASLTGFLRHCKGLQSTAVNPGRSGGVVGEGVEA